MSTEVKNEAGEKAAEQITPVAAPKEPEKAKAVEPAKVEPAKAAAKAEPEAKPASGERKRHVVKDDDDEIPEDTDLLELSPKALNGRLARHTKKQLRDHFGTDDVGEIKKQLARAKELEDKEEERRMAEMSEKDRMAEELKKEKARADDAERQHQEERDQRVFDQQDARVKEIAVEVIKAKHFDYVASQLAKHLLAEYPGKAIKKVDDKVIRAWFEDYAKENPEFAKEQPKAETPKVGFTNGADAKRPDASASGQAGVKTARPNQPNSMTKQEIAKLGYRY